MKCVVLAAGYGTRMQNLLGDVPKALVPLGNQVLLDTLMAQLAPLDLPTYLVSNSRYYDQFLAWQVKSGWPVDILDDGSTEPANRLGAIGDFAFVIKQLNLHDDLLLLAADNLIGFSLLGLLKAFYDRRQAHIAVRENPDREDQKRRGVVTLDENLRVTSFVEKPAEPLSNLAAAPVYLLPASSLSFLDDYLASGFNNDAPGHFMSYLVKRMPVYGWPVPGDIYDVGNPVSYRRLLDSFVGH
jgi:glucose-1-phosphate thymidylyltransferase